MNALAALAADAPAEADDRLPAPAFAAEGAHWLVDCYGVDAVLLVDAKAIERLLCDAAGAAGAHILFRHFHRFASGSPAGAPPAGPAGVTGVVLLAESHITIHTWPEHRFAAIDLFLCGATDPARAVACIEQGLRAERSVIRREQRGGDPGVAGGAVKGAAS